MLIPLVDSCMQPDKRTNDNGTDLSKCSKSRNQGEKNIHKSCPSACVGSKFDIIRPGRHSLLLQLTELLLHLGLDSRGTNDALSKFHVIVLQSQNVAIFETSSQTERSDAKTR
jgi:hypothetical protein